MAKKNNILLIGAGAAALYFLYNSKQTAPATTTTAATTTPTPGGSNLAVNTTPQLYGINSGLKGGNGSFYTVSNYTTLLAQDPNLGNVNYQLTDAEKAQYLSNYLDLQQGLPPWIGQKHNGITMNNINDAIQVHWSVYGVPEQRIFLPLVPPSGANFIPPPPNPKSSGSGLFKGILEGLTLVGGVALTIASAGAAAPIVAPAVAATLTTTAVSTESNILKGINEPPALLDDKEIEILVTGAAVAKDILPMLAQANMQHASVINTAIDNLVSQYN
jgi:hypothetical protein